MKEISVIAPIKSAEDIIEFCKNSECRAFYVYQHKFLEGNFEEINKYIENAHQSNAKIFVNFKHNIKEQDLVQIKKFIKYLKKTNLDGLFINSYAILEAIKTENLPFKIIIDSYFDIHNLSAIDFIKMFQKIDGLIITEEIYLKNIKQIKKYTDLQLAVDSDNIPWCMNELKKSKAIDAVVIKGDFDSSESILEGINLVEEIIDKPKMFKNQKLPFKHIRKSVYKTNHFSGEMYSSAGEDFEFSRHIRKFEFEQIQAELQKDFDYSSLTLPRICLRLSKLEHLEQLKKFIKVLGFNPVYSIEYGEILSTKDLYKSSFQEIIYKVKKFCKKNKINFNLSTPKILIERDFDRVFEYVKQSCIENGEPSCVVINNIGYFWAFINDEELNHIPVEIGYGVNLLNSLSIRSLINLQQIQGLDFSVFDDVKNIKSCISKVKNDIPTRKLTIAGNVRIPSLGLCPLNNDSAINSRLSCKAPCHRGNFALHDPSLDLDIPFAVDGFCKMHMFKDKILQMFNYIHKFEKIGINEFVIDYNNLNAKFVPILLTKLLNTVAKIDIMEDITLNEYNVDFFN